MFRRISMTGVLVTAAAFASAADTRMGVQRAPGQSSSQQGQIQRVAAPAGNKSGSSSGGLLGGLRGMFGGGGGGSSSETSGSGAIPDAPIGRSNAPMEDWSDISHAPQRAGTAKQNTSGATSGTAKSGVPKPPTNPNVPKPPTASTAQKTAPRDVPQPPSAKVAARPETGRNDIPVSSDASTRRSTSSSSRAVSSPPSQDMDPEGGIDDVMPVPKVSRRPMPQGAEATPPRTAQAPSQSGFDTGGTTRRQTTASAVPAQEPSDEGTGRRTNRSAQPGMTEERTAPSTPPSLNAPGAESSAAAKPYRTPGPSSNQASKTQTPAPTTNTQDSWSTPRSTSTNASSSNQATTISNGATSLNGSSNGMQGTNTLIATNVASSISEIPAVRVTTKGPSEVPINQVTEYEILVENRGANEAPGLLVRATIPDSISLRGHNVSRGEAVPENEQGERRILWQIDKIPAGGVEKLVLRLAAEKSAPFDVTVEWTCLPQINVASIRVQEPKLELHIDGPDQVVYGKSQVYSVRVLNPGNANAANVTFTLSPNSATPQSQRLGDIPAGKEAKFEIELSAQDRGELEIHGLVTGAGELRSESLKKIRVAAAQLVASFDGPPLKYQNTEANYRLLLVNEGTAPSQNVVAQLRIPNGVQYVSGIDGAEAVGDILRWQLTELAPGQTREYNVRCNMMNTGSHMLAFECAGTAAGAAAVSIATKVEAVADLVLSVNDPAAPAPVGSEVMYEIVLKNRGSKAATDIQAVAQFSQQIEPIRAEGHAAKLVPGQVIFDSINRLDAGQEIKLRVYAQASDGGVHRFRTEITSGEVVLVAEEATKYISQSGDRVTRKSTDQPIR